MKVKVNTIGRYKETDGPSKIKQIYTWENNIFWWLWSVYVSVSEL